MREKLEAELTKLHQVDFSGSRFNSLLVFLAYLGITVVMTYPVAFRLNSSLAGLGGDAFQHLWSLWWGKKAWIDLGTNLDDIRYLYYPLSVSHKMLSVTPVIQITSLPLVLLFGPLTAYNLHFLLAFALSGLTMYWLCLELTGSRWAAFVGGVIFAFAPHRLAHGLGHFAQIVTYWFPLYALFAIRLTRSPTWKNAIWVGIFLALSSLVNIIHVAYFVMPFTVLWLIYLFFTERQKLFSRAFVTRLGTAFALAGILVSPFFAPFILEKLAGHLEHFAHAGFTNYSCDLVAFLVPSPHNPVVKKLPGIRAWANSVLKGAGGHMGEGLAYLGITPLILALVGIVKQRRTICFWVCLGSLAAILSLGPLLKFNGELIDFHVDGRTSYIVLPYALLMQLPFYEWGRVPARLTETTMFALAVVATYGLAGIMSVMRRHTIRSVLATMMVVFIGVEYLVMFPYPVESAPIPDFYSQLRVETDESAILDYPVFQHDPASQREDVHSFNYPMYYQTRHEHPIVGGFIWRLPFQVTGTLKALHNLVAPQDERWPDILQNDLSVQERLQWLDWYNVRYVVLHHYSTAVHRHERPTTLVTHEREILASMFGPPLYQDLLITAFKSPEDIAHSPLSAPVPLIAIGKGWHKLEQVNDSYHRWLPKMASLYAYATAEDAYRLVFNAEAFNRPKHVDISVNDRQVASVVISSRRHFVSPNFILKPGANEIHFEADSCQRPADIDINADTRCLGALFSNVKLVSADDAVSKVEARTNFSDIITLLGYDLASKVFRPGEDVQLTLYWQANQQIAQDWSVFTHIVNETAQIVGQKDNMPVNDRYPTSWWAADEIVQDEYVIHIPEDTPPGSHILEVGLYLWQTGDRLSISDTGDNRVLLTEIEILPAH